MSLFKVCSWWSAQASDTEPNYDTSSLHCCRLNPEDNGKDLVIVGSHSGLLTIFKPEAIPIDQDDPTPTGFQPSDVILEQQLNAPILGITSGKFTAVTKNDTRNLLAVLHPLKLVVYAVITTGGIAEHGDYSRLHLLAEHNLKTSAFSVCKGQFGGVKGREFLCITHLDGSVKFFEQDGINFECQLPDERTIPAPMVYAARIDCFVTVSPAWELECFRYQDLIDAQQLKRTIVPIWSICVGEGVLDYDVHQLSNTESVIVLLGENNLICTTDTGKVKFIKRLDYSPVCFCSFVIGWYWEADARLMIAIVSDHGSLLIYDRSHLVWAAQLPEVPIAIQRANLQGLPGAIVTLSATGAISVGYLGSDPHLFKAPPLNLKPLDFIKAHKELTELEKEIQEGIDYSDVAVVNAAAERDVKVTAAFSANVDKCAFPTQAKFGDSDPKMCALNVNVKTNINLEQLQICVCVMAPLACAKQQFTFRELLAGSSERISCYVYLGKSLPVPSLVVKLFVSFVNKQSIVRVLERKLTLPLEMIVKTCQAQRDAKYKVTFLAEKGYQELDKLFPDLINESNAQAVGFKFMHTTNIVTVAIAKNSKRFRIQSDELTAIAPILAILTGRLKEKSSKDDRFEPIFASVIPIESLMRLIKEHYTIREAVNIILLEIDRRNAELALFERRLAVKSQEENAQTSGIQYLIELTTTKLSILEKRLKSEQTMQEEAQIHLSSLLNLTNLIALHSKSPKKASDLLRASLSPFVQDWTEQGWEEAIFPAIDMLDNVGPLRKDKNLTYDDYFSSTGAKSEFEFSRFEIQLREILNRFNRMSETSEEEKQDGEFTDTEDKIHEEASDWVNKDIPEAAEMLLGGAAGNKREAVVV